VKKKTEIALQAEKAAEDDWARHESAFLFPGEIDSSSPIVMESAFFLCCSSYDEEYADAYNFHLQELIKQRGVPAWAPGQRILSDQEILETLRLTKPKAIEEFGTGQEFETVSEGVDIWRYRNSSETVKIYHVLDKQMVLLVGPIGNVLVVEQFDLKSGECWGISEIPNLDGRL